MVKNYNEKPPYNRGGDTKSYSLSINYKTILNVLSSGSAKYVKLDHFCISYHSKKLNFYIKKRKNYNVDAMLYRGKTELFLLAKLGKEVFYISSLWRVFDTGKLKIYKLEYRGITFDLVIDNEKKEVFFKRTGEKGKENEGCFSERRKNAKST